MDIFVKKYQPERYDLWRLGLEDSYPSSQNNSSLSTPKRSRLLSSNSIFNSPAKAPLTQLELETKLSIESYLHSFLKYYAIQEHETKMDENNWQENKRIQVLENLFTKNSKTSFKTELISNLPIVLQNCFTNSNHRTRPESLVDTSSSIAIKLFDNPDLSKFKFNIIKNANLSMDESFATSSSFDLNYSFDSYKDLCQSSYNNEAILMDETDDDLNNDFTSSNSNKFNCTIELQNQECDSCKLFNI